MFNTKNKPKKKIVSLPNSHNPTTQQHLLENKTSLVDIKDENKIVKSLMFLSGGVLISTLIILILAINSFFLSTKKTIYVEQLNGTTELAVEKDRYYRSNDVIQQTLTTWLYLTWEWDTTLPNSQQKDPGVEFGTPSENLKVPTKTYIASYLIEEGFRQEFLKKITTIIPPSVYQNQISQLTSHLTIYHLSTPKRINDTTYQINAIFTRIDLENGREKHETKSAKTFILKAIEPHQLTLEKAESSIFRNKLNELLRNGLIISEIKDYQVRED